MSVAQVIIPLLLAVPAVFAFHSFRNPSRLSKIPKSKERVLILGATSGIGRKIASEYAARGARVCVVGRRQVLLDEVVLECQEHASKIGGERTSCFGVRADFANVDDMVRLRVAVEEGGLIELYSSD